MDLESNQLRLEQELESSEEETARKKMEQEDYLINFSVWKIIITGV